MAIRSKQNTIDQRDLRYEVGNIVLYDTIWDDLRFPATGISIGSLTSPPDQQPDTGLLLFDGGITNETIAVMAQMPHSWHIGTEIHPHVHWAKTTDAAGTVQWSFRYKIIEIGEVATAWSSVFNATDLEAVDSTQKHMISEFPPIDMSNYGLSTCILMQIGRLPADAGDTYGADALLYEFDLHYQLDSFGSQEELIKETRD